MASREPLRTDAPVACLKGAGPKKTAVLASMGIVCLEDLLRYYPRSWEDRRNRVSIRNLREGEPAGFTATVLSISGATGFMPGGRETPLLLRVEDETGRLDVVFFHGRYLKNTFQVGARFSFFGTPQLRKGGLQLIHPDFARAEDMERFFAVPILPVYGLRAGITMKDMRGWQEQIRPLAASLMETLPLATLKRQSLCGADFAFSQIHFPRSRDGLRAAKYRLIFEELLILQTGLFRLKNRKQWEKKGFSFPADFELRHVSALLPWTLTGAQAQVIQEIFRDMEAPLVMNRMVQGDVGSGKTAVAMAAILKASASGVQSALMAPTEILARQHYHEFQWLFGDMQADERLLRIDFLSSSVRAAERTEILARLAAGETDLLIGTHAVLQPDVGFQNLGLVVTDEQHRFGVGQRIRLSKKGKQPDILVMTATPIPRTLAFILYGDLDISIIDTLPPGRKPVRTKAVRPDRRNKVYDFVGGELKKGRQAYIVAPLIEDDEQRRAAAEVRSAESLYRELSDRFSFCRVALLHGAMKQKDKEEIMGSFAAGQIQALVSTVVIEVGVNVPNATVMVVENAERFGLAQLHQLRGRVGRGAEKSYCVFISDGRTEEARQRVGILEGTSDGFEIAEMDLHMRGPGDFFGVRQHGLPDFQLADLARHGDVLVKVREEAERLLTADPELTAPEHEGLRRRVERLFAEAAEIGL